MSEEDGVSSTYCPLCNRSLTMANSSGIELDVYEFHWQTAHSQEAKEDKADE